MSDNEKFDFEAEMEQNPALKEEVEMFGLMESIVVGAQYHELSSKMTSDIQKIDTQKSIKKWILVAAGVLISSLAFWGITKENKTEDKTPLIVSTNMSETNQPTISDSKPTQKENKKDSKPTVSSPKEKESVNKKDVVSIEKKEIENDTPILEEIPTKVSPVLQETPQIKNEKPINPCVQANLNFDVKITASCVGEDNGKIELIESSISGASKPYRTQLNNKELSPILSYYDLEEGVYRVTLVDGNGCSKTKSIEIKNTNCQETKFVLNPSYGNFLDLHNFKNTRKIEIYNQRGVLIFSEKSPNLNYTWEAKDLNGKSLEAGVYALIIEFNDGKIEYGQITIIQ